MASRPPFVLGVAGKRFFPGDGDSSPLGSAFHDVREITFAVLNWIRAEPGEGGFNPIRRKFVELKNEKRGKSDELIWPGLGLSAHPIILLSNLAPGVDTIVAEAVMDFDLALTRAGNVQGPVAMPEYAHAGIGHEQAVGSGFVTVRAPLPFPSGGSGRYTDTSSFNEKGGGAAFLKTRAARVEEFSKIVSRIRGQVGFLEPRDLFPVRLNAALEDPKGLGDARFIDDIQNKPRYRIRYRAASEYLAAYSQMLLAFTAGEKLPELDEAIKSAPIVEPGTLSAIAAKRRGATFGLLEGSSVFTWADNGPTMVVPLLDDAGNGSEVSLVHPLDTQRSKLNSIPLHRRMLASLGIVSKKWAEEVAMAKGGGQKTHFDPDAGMRYFREMVSMHRVAPCSIGGNDVALVELRNLLSLPRNPDDPARFANSTPEEESEGSESERREEEGLLHRSEAAVCKDLARVRIGAKKGGVRVEPDAAPLIGVYRADKERKMLMARLAKLIAVAALALAAYEHWPVPIDSSEAIFPSDLAGWVRALLLLVCVTSVVVSAWIYRKYLRLRAEQIRFDYRAVLDAIRVQIYWVFAGIPLLAADEYMQRQRPELDWIRAVMVNLCAPSSQWTEVWKSYSRNERVIAYRAIRRGWIVSQLLYFRKNAAVNAMQARRCHTFGWALALAGLLNVIGKFVDATFIPARHWMEHHPGYLAWWLFGVGAGLLAFKVILDFPKTQQAIKRIGLNFGRLSHGGEHGPSPRTWFLWWLVARPLIFGYGLIVSSVVFMLPHVLPHGGAFPSNSHSWWLITTSVPLVLGGLTVAWSERSFFSEHARRYRAMEELFACANPRLKSLIKELSDGPAPRAESEIRATLIALGREALEENSEWLVQHRARPMEPFMGG